MHCILRVKDKWLWPTKCIPCLWRFFGKCFGSSAGFRSVCNCEELFGILTYFWHLALLEMLIKQLAIAVVPIDSDRECDVSFVQQLNKQELLMVQADWSLTQADDIYCANFLAQADWLMSAAIGHGHWAMLKI